MLPVSCMPICALLMGIGYCMCPAAMQGGEIAGVAASIGYFLIRAGSALLDHIAWLMIITLLNVDTISVLMPGLAENSNKLLAFSKIENPFQKIK